MHGDAEMEQRVFTVGERIFVVGLEEPFWDCLEDIAEERDLSLRSLVHQIGREYPRDISSALRLHVLEDVLRKSGFELTAAPDACELMSKYH
jgi:predicted DNA-binding ribbon-helix-helix protein